MPGALVWLAGQDQDVVGDFAQALAERFESGPLAAGDPAGQDDAEALLRKNPRDSYQTYP